MRIEDNNIFLQLFYKNIKTKWVMTDMHIINFVLLNENVIMSSHDSGLLREKNNLCKKDHKLYAEYLMRNVNMAQETLNY